MSTESTLAKEKPGTYSTFPAAAEALSWIAIAKSGLGNFVKSPSSIISRAPPPASSAGWPTMTSVPAQWLFPRERSVAAPTHDAMWMSCPQACMTCTVSPRSSVVVTLLA
jgi:hypothetical protein